MLRKEAVVQEMLDLTRELQSIPMFERFYLAGGTSLALQIGHRTSTDIDLFTYSGGRFPEINVFLNKNKDKYSLNKNLEGFIRFYSKGIKVELVYDDVGKLLFIPEEEDGIKYLSKKEIVPMKLNAASDRGKGRDFIDIAFLLQDFTLSEMFDLYKKKYDNVNINILKRNLIKNLDKLEEDEWLKDIKMLRDDIKIKDIPFIIEKAINDYNESVGIKIEANIIKDKNGNTVTILKKELLTIKNKIKIYKLKCKDKNFADIYILQYKQNKKTINHFFNKDFALNEILSYLNT